MGSKLYVANLAYSTSSDTLRSVFARDGRSVRDVHIVMDRETGRPRGFAFVTMGSEDEARQATLALDGQEVDGRPLRISEARERTGGPPAGGLRDRRPVGDFEPRGAGAPAGQPEEEGRSFRSSALPQGRRGGGPGRGRGGAEERRGRRERKVRREREAFDGDLDDWDV